MIDLLDRKGFCLRREATVLPDLKPLQAKCEFSGKIADLKRGDLVYEEIEVHRGADRIYPSANRPGNTRGGALPGGGGERGNYFRWKQKYGGLGPSELRKIRQLTWTVANFQGSDQT